MMTHEHVQEGDGALFFEPFVLARELSIAQNFLALAQKHSVPFPFGYSLGTDRSRTAQVLVDERDALHAFRQDMATWSKETLGKDSDVTISLELFVAIAGHLDEVFLHQISQGYESGTSWNDHAPEAVAGLRRTIDALFASDRYGPHLSKNSGMRMVLETMGGQLPDARDPQTLYELSQKIEDFARRSYEEGHMVMLLPLSQWYIPKRDGVTALDEILEANIRLLLPIERKGAQRLEKFCDRVWQHIVETVPARKAYGKEYPGYPAVLVGTTIGFGGSELFSMTVAESFNSHAVMYSPNQRRDDRVFDRIYEMIGKLPPKNARNVSFLLFLPHEFCHSRYEVKTPMVAELVPDLTMVVVAVNILEEFSPVMQASASEAFIVSLLSEYAVQAESADPTYRLSSVHILDNLVKSGCVSFDPTSKTLTIHADAGHLRALKTICKDTLEAILHCESSQNTKELFSSVPMAAILEEEISGEVKRIMACVV